MAARDLPAENIKPEYDQETDEQTHRNPRPSLEDIAAHNSLQYQIMRQSHYQSNQPKPTLLETAASFALLTADEERIVAPLNHVLRDLLRTIDGLAQSRCSSRTFG
jgi:hypothetical protein